jgi:hypothetical protein
MEGEIRGNRKEQKENKPYNIFSHKENTFWQPAQIGIKYKDTKLMNNQL